MVIRGLFDGKAQIALVSALAIVGFSGCTKKPSVDAQTLALQKSEKTIDNKPEASNPAEVRFTQTRVSASLVTNQKEELILGGSCNQGSSVRITEKSSELADEDSSAASSAASAESTVDSSETVEATADLAAEFPKEIATVSCVNGAWQYSYPLPKDDGLKVLSLAQADSTGNVLKELEQSIRVDRTPPEVVGGETGSKTVDVLATSKSLNLDLEVDSYEQEDGQMYYQAANQPDCSDVQVPADFYKLSSTEKESKLNVFKLNSTTNKEVKSGKLLKIGKVNSNSSKYVLFVDSAGNSVCREIKTRLVKSSFNFEVGFVNSNEEFVAAEGEDRVPMWDKLRLRFVSEETQNLSKYKIILKTKDNVAECEKLTQADAKDFYSADTKFLQIPGAIDATSAPVEDQVTQFVCVVALFNDSQFKTKVVPFIFIRPHLSYEGGPGFALKVGEAIKKIVPTHNFGRGGNISYSISPALPNGLAFDKATGEISGVPSEKSAENTYTVTAKMEKWEMSYDHSLQVSIQEGSVAPPSGSGSAPETSQPVLSYSHGNSIYIVGLKMTDNVPTLTGAKATKYSIEPKLPAGFSFGEKDGKITGTPSAIAVSLPYTITADLEGGGEAKASIRFAINSPPTLKYKVSNAAANTASVKLDVAYSPGQAIPGLEGLASGGSLLEKDGDHYTIVPELMNGLSLDRKIGKISGTISKDAPQGKVDYKITATFAGFPQMPTATATVSMTIGAPTGASGGATSVLAFTPGDRKVFAIVDQVDNFDLSKAYEIKPQAPAGKRVTKFTCSFSPSSFGPVCDPATGNIAGKVNATTPGKYTYTMKAELEGGGVAEGSLVVELLPKPSYPPANNPVNPRWPITLSPIDSQYGGSRAFFFSLDGSSALPAGLSISSSTGDGVITGVPSAVGATTTMIRAKHHVSNYYVRIPVNFNVIAKPSYQDQTCYLNQVCSINVTPTTGGSQYALSNVPGDALPKGMSVKSDTGQINGTYTWSNPGDVTYKMTAKVSGVEVFVPFKVKVLAIPVFSYPSLSKVGYKPEEEINLQPTPASSGDASVAYIPNSVQKDGKNYYLANLIEKSPGSFDSPINATSGAIQGKVRKNAPIGEYLYKVDLKRGPQVIASTDLKLIIRSKLAGVVPKITADPSALLPGGTAALPKMTVALDDAVKSQVKGLMVSLIAAGQPVKDCDVFQVIQSNVFTGIALSKPAACSLSLGTSYKYKVQATTSTDRGNALPNTLSDIAESAEWTLKPEVLAPIKIDYKPNSVTCIQGLICEFSVPLSATPPSGYAFKSTSTLQSGLTVAQADGLIKAASFVPSASSEVAIQVQGTKASSSNLDGTFKVSVLAQKPNFAESKCASGSECALDLTMASVPTGFTFSSSTGAGEWDAALKVSSVSGTVKVSGKVKFTTTTAKEESKIFYVIATDSSSVVRVKIPVSFKVSPPTATAK